MKILLLGKNGQVGWELQRALQPLGEVIALDRQRSEEGFCGDISNFEAIDFVLQQLQPDVIVNATAYTAVDKAESEPNQAELINSQAVKHLAVQAKKNGALLIHYSTDYVFNGEGENAWKEDDQTAPVNLYGQTKRQGEVELEQSGVAFINFRTCWVYAARGHNFIKTMLKLGHMKEELNIINDQVGVPTGAALIADVTAQVLRYYFLQTAEQKSQLHGHYHLAPKGETTWFDYANFVFDQASKQGQIFVLKSTNPIATEAYPTPAKRPLNSRLNTEKLQQKFKIHLPYWQQGVIQVLEEILS